MSSPRNGDPVPTRIPCILLLTLATGVAYAAEEPDQASGGGFLQAPTVEPSAVTGEPVEPDITIKESGGNVVYEYRVHGVLYMAKIQPQVGPPYYMYDLNGDGILDADDRSPHNVAVPQWEILHWR